MEEHHSSAMSGHFSSEKLMKFCHAISGGRVHMEMLLLIVGPAHSVPLLMPYKKTNQLLLHPLSAEQVLQIIGVDVMDLLLTDNGNHHVVVFQDFCQNGHWFFWFWIR